MPAGVVLFVDMDGGASAGGFSLRGRGRSGGRAGWFGGARAGRQTGPVGRAALLLRVVDAARNSAAAAALDGRPGRLVRFGQRVGQIRREESAVLSVMRTDQTVPRLERRVLLGRMFLRRTGPGIVHHLGVRLVGEHRRFFCFLGKRVFQTWRRNLAVRWSTSLLADAE